MIDGVLSCHVNTDGCGVAKFNQQLAGRLGVPFGWTSDLGTTHPLLSIKASELEELQIAGILRRPVGSFDVLWHDQGIAAISARARRVLYAAETGCPSTIRGDSTRPGLSILTYGMAHKAQIHHFARLKEILRRSGHLYHLAVSSVMHEGLSWQGSLHRQRDLLTQVFGPELRWLGTLADDALAREIRNAHTIALFYDPAVRANNTTLWAALDAGTPVITNLDAQSPPELKHNVSVFDIHQLTEWPEYDGRRQDIRAGGRKAAAVYSWDRLIAQLTAVHA